MDGWIEKILQKHLKTGQNNYMFEARLLVKYKDFLGRIGGANIPVTDGVRDVTVDYQAEWGEYAGGAPGHPRRGYSGVQPDPARGGAAGDLRAEAGDLTNRVVRCRAGAPRPAATADRSGHAGGTPERAPCAGCLGGASFFAYGYM